MFIILYSPSRLPVESDDNVCHILVPHGASAVGDFGDSFGSNELLSSEPEMYVSYADRIFGELCELFFGDEREF